MYKIKYFEISSLITLVLVLLVASSATAKSEVIRILPLGDSITHAEINRASYRYFLWKSLIDEGIEFDFVGSMNTQLGRYSQGKSPQPDYKGKQFDPDHEGHFGWQANEIVDGRNPHNGTGSGSLSEWMGNYDFDITLVHLGTNDAFYRQSNQQISGEIKAVINTLRKDNPQVVILLAKVIPTSRSRADAQAVSKMNEIFPAIVEDMHNDSSAVILVDQFVDFDATRDTYDGVHPNESGEKKMAQRWFEAIKQARRDFGNFGSE